MRKCYIFTVLLCSLFTMQATEKADLVIFSYDRPLQLYAFLESAQKYLKGIGETIVIYRATEKDHYQFGYQLVNKDFPRVKFVAQGENPKADFKPLTLQATFDSSSKYVIFAVDDIVVKDHVDLSTCIEHLEREQAYGFYLRLGEHLDFCYTMNKAQHIPELKAVSDEVRSWTFAASELDWAYPNTVDMTLYRKADIEPAFRSIDFTSPNTLEGRWAGHANTIMHRQGLCFKDSKMVNLPLNRVQTDFSQNLSMEIKPFDLQIKFLQGMKLDIAPLAQIKNRSAHMEYEPTYVARLRLQNKCSESTTEESEVKRSVISNVQKRDLLGKLGIEDLDELIGSNIVIDADWYKKISDLDEKHIVIVTPSFKNAEWYKWNLDSVFSQNYTNWHMIYIDDCSPDGTGELVRAYVKERGFEDKVTVLANKNRRKALANLHTAITMCAPTDIIAILDGDDRFAFEDVLKQVNFMYTAYDVWLTYGQFKEYPSGRIGFCKPYPNEIVKHGAFRNYAMGPSHLRTFYAGLFHKIKLEDLCYKGDFFPMTYDLAIMLPMIEMAREHFMFCATPLVDYNTSNPINDHKVSQELQRKCDKAIRSRGQYSKLEKLFDKELV